VWVVVRFFFFPFFPLLDKKGFPTTKILTTALESTLRAKSEAKVACTSELRVFSEVVWNWRWPAKYDQQEFRQGKEILGCNSGQDGQRIGLGEVRRKLRKVKRRWEIRRGREARGKERQEGLGTWFFSDLFLEMSRSLCILFWFRTSYPPPGKLHI
jgi:hypothetical protein